MELIIKKFSNLNNQELYDILSLRNSVFVVEQDCPFQDCDYKDQDSYHLYFESGSDIAAYLRIIPAGISYQQASIGRVLVKEEFRGRGLGLKLMKKAISFILENFEAQQIKISAQEYILDFYRKVGFKVVSERYLEDDIPHYEMLCDASV